jgi:GDPmannose 4,6-dehydratase
LDLLGIKKEISFIYADISEFKQVELIIKKIKPKIFFNLAAQSFVAYSFNNPEYTDKINNSAVINILESIRLFSPSTKFYQASSSEMFGDTNKSKAKLNENSKFNPVSPYAISKLSAYFYTRFYRSGFGIFASNGILFNHEGPLRGEQFVTKKIIKGLIHFLHSGEPLHLGNIYSKRDWGDAEEYTKLMYKIMLLNKPNDFVVATGKAYSIKEFINLACSRLELKIKWTGSGVSEKATNAKGKPVILIKKNFFRPHDVTFLLGDSLKIKKYLKWEPSGNTLIKLIDNMIEFEQKNYDKKNSSL